MNQQPKPTQVPKSKPQAPIQRLIMSSQHQAIAALVAASAGDAADSNNSIGKGNNSFGKNQVIILFKYTHIAHCFLLYVKITFLCLCLE
jgi:hypothetical protein